MHVVKISIVKFNIIVNYRNFSEGQCRLLCEKFKLYTNFALGSIQLGQISSFLSLI